MVTLLTYIIEALVYARPGTVELLEVEAAQVFLDTSSLSGIPDGMTVDRDGNLWVAFWDGSCVRSFSPEGERLATSYFRPPGRPVASSAGAISTCRSSPPRVLASQPTNCESTHSPVVFSRSG